VGAIAIYSCGMMTSVGWTGPTSCAAIRAGITGFVETPFEFAGEPLLGSPVPLAADVVGVDRLRQMVVSSLRECLPANNGSELERIPLLLCVAEKDRRGRFIDLAGQLPGRRYADRL